MSDHEATIVAACRALVKEAEAETEKRVEADWQAVLKAAGLDMTTSDGEVHIEVWSTEQSVFDAALYETTLSAVIREQVEHIVEHEDFGYGRKLADALRKGADAIEAVLPPGSTDALHGRPAQAGDASASDGSLPSHD